jgi:hypothetical protein
LFTILELYMFLFFHIRLLVGSILFFMMFSQPGILFYPFSVFRIWRTLDVKHMAKHFGRIVINQPLTTSQWNPYTVQANFMDIPPIAIRPTAVLIGTFPSHHLEWMTLDGCIGFLIVFIPLQAAPSIHFQALFMQIMIVV